MKKILKTKTWLLFVVVILIGYLIDILALNVVINDTLWQQHLNEKYEKKYNEFKEYDLDLDEFGDELAAFEEQLSDDSSYNWESFYVDTLFVIVPIIIMTFGYGCVLLLLLLFHKTLNIIKYILILKATIVAYLVFYIPDVVSNIYFLVFNRNYKIEDISEFARIFKTSSLFNKEQLPEWLWSTISDFQLVYILFPAITAISLKVIYKQFNTGLLLTYTYLAYIIGFALYEIIMWYIFGF